MFFSDVRASSLAFQTSHRSWLLPKRSFHRRRHFGIRAEVNYVNADEAKNLVASKGYAIVDVRDITQFERAHIKSCYHIPIFIENKDNDPGIILFLEWFKREKFMLFEFCYVTDVWHCAGTIIKRTLHNNFSGLFYGLPFTKTNPDFLQSVKSQFSPDSKLLLVCQEGLRLVSLACFAVRKTVFTEMFHLLICQFWNVSILKLKFEIWCKLT